MQPKFQEEMKAERMIKYWNRMVKKVPKSNKKKKTDSCLDCEYYHPDWAYRKCYYVECPYKKKKYTLRKKPVKKGMNGNAGVAFV